MKRLALALGIVSAMLGASVVYAALGSGETLLDTGTSEFTYSSTAGWGTFGVYAEACRLQAENTTVTFTVPSGYTWTMTAYGYGRATNGAGVTVDGGGASAYQSGPFASGTFTLTASDGTSTHASGTGGGSWCGRAITLTAEASPSPSPTPTPTPTPTPAPSSSAAPSPTPAPTESAGPLCDPYCNVALVPEDRDRIDLLTFAAALGFFVVGALQAALVVAKLRR